MAASPTSRSPFGGVNATKEGVIRLPCEFVKISTRPRCCTPTHEYVVPRSIPITGPRSSEDEDCATAESAKRDTRTLKNKTIGDDHEVPPRLLCRDTAICGQKNDKYLTDRKNKLQNDENRHTQTNKHKKKEKGSFLDKEMGMKSKGRNRNRPKSWKSRNQKIERLIKI